MLGLYTCYEFPYDLINYQRGRAVAQAVSRRPPTPEAWVRSRVSPYGICGGQSDTGTGFFPEYFGFPLSVSFHRCSITTKRIKNNNNYRHLHHRVAQEASMLRCVRSVCCCVSFWISLGVSAIYSLLFRMLSVAGTWKVIYMWHIVPFQVVYKLLIWFW
jgi:hypothetical protein